MRGEEELQAMSPEKFCCRVFDTGGDRILAVCDSSVLGMVFEDDGLRIHVSEEFYFSEERDESGIVSLMESCTIVNAVGEKIIGIMLEKGIVDEGCILRVSGVPHAQVV